MLTSKLPDLDRISSKFFKNGPEFLALFFTNLSIKQSLIPHQGNNTKQKPLLEKDTKSDPKNYRPNLLLPVVSETEEKSICIQVE